MVVGSYVKQQVRQKIFQHLVKRGKPVAVKYITAGYGELAGGIAGVGISVAIGDYYGAFQGLSGNNRDGPFNGRNPPFGYFEGEGINGSPPGAQYQTLRTVAHKPNRIRNRGKQLSCDCYRCLRQKHKRRR